MLTTITYNKQQIEDFLKEHIIRGDKGDGIPNFLSADDVFVKGIRQSTIREVKLIKWLKQDPEEFCDEQSLTRYKRNEALVDLSKIPSHIEEDIMRTWEVPIKGSKSKIFPYLIKNKMKNLIEVVHEF